MNYFIHTTDRDEKHLETSSWDHLKRDSSSYKGHLGSPGFGSFSDLPPEGCHCFPLVAEGCRKICLLN